MLLWLTVLNVESSFPDQGSKLCPCFGSTVSSSAPPGKYPLFWGVKFSRSLQTRPLLTRDSSSYRCRDVFTYTQCCSPCPLGTAQLANTAKMDFVSCKSRIKSQLCRGFPVLRQSPSSLNLHLLIYKTSIVTLIFQLNITLYIYML